MKPSSWRRKWGQKQSQNEGVGPLFKHLVKLNHRITTVELRAIFNIENKRCLQGFRTKQIRPLITEANWKKGRSLLETIKLTNPFSYFLNSRVQSRFAMSTFSLAVLSTLKSSSIAAVSGVSVVRHVVIDNMMLHLKYSLWG